MADGYVPSYRELIETTDWASYGRGNDPRCANCMAHCGYEPTAVAATSASLREGLRAAGDTLRGQVANISWRGRVGSGPHHPEGRARRAKSAGSRDGRRAVRQHVRSSRNRAGGAHRLRGTAIWRRLLVLGGIALAPAQAPTATPCPAGAEGFEGGRRSVSDRGDGVRGRARARLAARVGVFGAGAGARLAVAAPAPARPHRGERDVRDGGALVPSIRGCRLLVHVAAGYSFAPRDRRELEQVNVAGTRSLLEAARLAGVEKAVVTSSSAAVGPLRGGRLATENDWAAVHAGPGYHSSKVRQERAALRANLPVVNGAADRPHRPARRASDPTGQMVIDVMRNRIPAYLDGG